MSRIISGSTGVLMASLMVYILVMSTFYVLVSAGSSVDTWNVDIPSTHGHKIDSISDLLLARTGPDSSILVKAKQIIRDLSSSSTCSHAPTVRLLRQCKEIKPKHKDAQSDYQLNNAEAVYAISMALCEATQARVATPKACQIFVSLVERPLSDSSIEIIRSAEIEACSAVLYGTPGWTSYSTYRFNSKFLCESSRTDYQREELLQTLRDATDVIPEILHVLHNHRNEAQMAMMQLRETASHAELAQQEILLHAQEQERLQSAQLQQFMQYIKAMQETMDQALSNNSKALDLNTGKANAVDQKLSELYASFAEAAYGMTFDLNDQIVALSRQTSSMLKQIHDLGTQGSLDKLQATMHSVSQSAADLARLQTEQIETGREVLEAFHNFKPEQLLPKWLREFSASIVDLAFLLKTEGPLAIVFAAPTFCLFMFGRFRLASCMLAAYFFSRCLWSFALVGVEVLTYLTDTISPMFVHFHLQENLAFLAHRDVHLAGVCLLGLFIICYFTTSRLRGPNSIDDKSIAMINIVEKRSTSSVKENFERSRRACSVPLDCECA